MKYVTTSQQILNNAFDRESRLLKTVIKKKSTNGSAIKKDRYLQNTGLSLQQIFNAVYDRQTGCLTINGNSNIDSDAKYYTAAQVDEKFSQFSRNLHWKQSVSSYDDLNTVYPNPEQGWTVSVNDTNKIYRYDSETQQWVFISTNTIDDIPIASYDTKGTASFSSTYFVVDNGAVSIDTNVIATKSYVDTQTDQNNFFTEQQLRFLNWGSNLNQSQLNSLKSYIDSYDDFVKIYNNNFKINEYTITMSTVNQGGQLTPVYVTLDGIQQNIDDQSNLDGDADTLYRIDIPGYVVDVQNYANQNSIQMDRCYPKMVYDKECFDVLDSNIQKKYGVTHIYFTQDEYNTISSFSNNKNIVKIHFIQMLNADKGIHDLQVVMSSTVVDGVVAIDTQNLDGDPQTQYRFDVPGYVVSVQGYANQNSVQMDRFFPKMVYDKECMDTIKQGIDKTYGITHIYFTQDQYDWVSNLNNNRNIVRIYYLKF